MNDAYGEIPNGIYLERRKPCDSTGDSYDNAMAESINGLYKAEVIHRKSWKNRKRRLSTVWQILKFLRE
ncbi:TPA: hypothetical protein IGR32_003311 [Escherichia coli]|nr:hypothetical protein [Escherichia coli]